MNIFRLFTVPIFFCNILKIECFVLRAAILVSVVLSLARGWVSPRRPPPRHIWKQDGRLYHQALNLEDLTKKIVDCEQSRLVWTIHLCVFLMFATWQLIGQMGDAGRWWRCTWSLWHYSKHLHKRTYFFKSGKIASCIWGYLLAIKAKYVLNFYEGE